MDGRKNNGGHSTKAKGVDGRANKYKSLVTDEITPDKFVNILKMLYEKAIKEQDTKAAQMLLEHTVGKPKDSSFEDAVKAFAVINLEEWK